MHNVQTALGMVVKATAGRDKGKFFVVAKIDGPFVWLADGKSRRLAAPKKKKVIHIEPTNDILSGIANKICEKKQIFDSELKSALRNYNESNGGTF